MKKQSQDIYPLSPLQEAFLYHSITDRSSSAYFSQLSYEVSGRLDAALFEDSLAHLFDRHSILRTAFVYEGLKQAYQVVIKDRRAEFHRRDLRDLDAAAQAQFFEEFSAREKRRNFDLTKDSLMRIHLFSTAEGRYRVYWAFHHILFDGWSFTKVINEFGYIYSCLEAGQQPDLPPALPYKRFIQWLRRQDKAAAMEHWKQQLAGYEQRATLCPSYPPQTEGSTQQGEYFLHLGPARSQHLAQMATQQRVTLNTLILGLWGLLLTRHNDRRDVVFGKISSMRPPEIKRIDSMVGLFINTLPVRIRYGAETRLGDLLRQIQQDNLAAEKYNYCSLAEIQAATPLKKALIDHLLVLGNDLTASETPAEDEELGTGSWRVEASQHREEVDYDFSMHVTTAETIDFTFTYNTGRYAEAAMQRLGQQVLLIADQMIADPNLLVADLAIVPVVEKQQLLNWSGQRKAYAPLAFHEIVANWAQQEPERLALVTGKERWTYAQLDRTATALAQHLAQHQGIAYQTRVGLFMDRSVWSVASLLALWKLGAIYVPIDIQYPAARSREVLDAAAVSLVLTTADLRERLPDLDWPVLTVETLQLEWHPTAEAPPRVAPVAIAYLIHTSGTSGKPKRIPIRHESISDRIQYHNDYMKLSDREAVLHLAGLHFDSSLVEIGMALLSGGSLIIAGPLEKSNPERLLQLLEEEAVSTAIFTPAFLQLLDKHPLPTLRHIISTGEAAALRETLYYARTKAFYNGYGPSEACIGATFHKVDPQRAADYQRRGSILIGEPFKNTRVYILDGQHRLLPQGAAGEIAIAGLGLTEGYLDRPDLTAKKFITNPFAQADDERRLYLSGDLGRWTEAGELEFLGRIDEQVQIRGIRVELREIEHRIAQHPDVKEVRVLARSDARQQTVLIAYFTSAVGCRTAETLRDYLTRYLPVYMIPRHFVALDAFPLTSNGKIDRQALPQPLASGEAEEDAGTVSPEEERMIALWQSVLEDPSIGVNSNFYDHGGHSLKAISLVLRIQREFERSIPIQEVLLHPSPRLLVRKLLTVPEQSYQGIEPVAESADYEASPAQKRTWLLSQFEGATTVYNVPGSFLIEGELDFEALEQSLQKVVARHDILRTTFRLVDGVLRQKVRAYRADFFQLVEVDLRSSAQQEQALEERMAAEYSTPFDLERGPLLRAYLLRLSDQRQLFLFTLHHIISDGWSIQLFFKELLAGYAAFQTGEKPTLATLPIQHKDYTHWLYQQLRGEGLSASREYWHAQFADEIPVLEFPTDKRRPANKTFRAQEIPLTIPSDLYRRVRDFGQQQDLTVFTLLLGALKLLLGRYAQQSDVVVGTVIAGRERAELVDQMGFFSNTLALRTRFSPEDRIDQFLERVKTVVQGAFQHQSFPFEYLIDELPVKRDVRRSPIFDVMMPHQNADLFTSETPKVAGLDIQHYALGTTSTAKFDLELVFTEYEAQLEASIVFNSDLFLTATLERFGQQYLKVLEALCTSSEGRVGDIEIISVAERQALVYDWNDTEVPTGERTFVDLFAEQVAATPNNVALNCEERERTYRQMAEFSNQVAHYLREERGIRAGQVVVYYGPRNEWWLMAVLGIMKAGAVYLPVSTKGAQDRTRYMLGEVAADLVLTDGQPFEVVGDIPQLDLAEIRRGDWSTADAREHWPAWNDLAYVLFTSGSTGRPKAVGIEHRSMANHVLSKRDELTLIEDTIIAQTGAAFFDVSIWQSFSALVAGGYTRIYPDEVVMDPLRLLRELDYDEVTIFQAVPSHLASLLETLRRYKPGITFGHLRYMMCAGEVFPPALLEEWFKHFVFVTVINQYGPTEACDGVCAEYLRAPSKQGTVPIGRPHQNVRIYIMDDQQRLCPVGVKGEIYIAGLGLARGYLNRPDLTEAAFLPDPFYPGERMYRSRDLGRWTAAGVLECFGRNDGQVKIRGHRIELAEVEQAFYRLPFVGKVAIIQRGDMDTGKYLSAYFTLREGMMATTTETRKRLAEFIPAFMIPEQLQILATMPRTASGKIDRRRLPEVERMAEGKVGREIVLPTSATESTLLDIWRAVLGQEQISTDDNFFEIGGHSFKAIKIQTLVHKQMGIQLTIKAIFTHSDIQAQAAHIDALQSVVEWSDAV